MNSTTEDFDDSWIREEDKKNLLLCIKNIYTTGYPWADDVLLKCMIKEHFKQTVLNMDKDAYIEETSKQDVDTMLDTII